MDKYIGRLLDNRYEILEVIGTGGMAVVYKARCHRLNRLVAIKILKDDYLEDEDFRQRFHSESQAVAMLSHPNIVSVYDVSTSIMADYIVMELIDGITLKQYMEKKGVLNWKETLHFAIQIAKALEHAHSRGIVHRDIKPHNVMVLKNGSVKVTDFGIARVMSQSSTLTKEALGSVHYISPEQAKGGRVDNRSDIYSLGVVMYEMMSGRPPYDGESPVAVAIQHINGGAVMPSTFNPNIPGGLEQIIMKAMSLDPNDRYMTATQMLADLDEFRKHPDMLFSYNVPPTDAVIHMPRPAQPKPVRTSIAQNAERRDLSQRRTGAGTPAPRQRQDIQSRPAARRTAKAEQEEKRSKIATISIISCAVVMVVAIAIFLIVTLGGGKLVEVPDLRGKVYEDLPDYANFEIKLSGEVHSDKYPAGQVAEQSPDPGEQIKKNSTIYVTVSLGEVPEEMKMPDLVNWDVTEAERVLKDLKMDLKIKVLEENSDTVEQARVVRTNPLANTDLTTGKTVTLYISKGQKIKASTMPNVAGKTEEKAKTILKDQDLDLQVVTEEIFDSKEPKGNVVRTTPAAGDEVKTGQSVTLYISKGAEVKALPAILERNVANAVSMLSTAGFNNYKTESAESDQEKDTVIAMKIDGKTVSPGTQVDVTQEITLVVSKGKNTPTVTKNVVIDLRGGASAGDCHVVVKRDGVEVYNHMETKGTQSVTIFNQTGSGSVIYHVIVDEEGFNHVEEFN